MSQMLKSTGAMGLATLASRMLGLVRDMLYAWFMGDSRVAGAFAMAFMIPNLFRRLLGEGALTAAFIPIFKEKEKKEGDAAMWEAGNAVISALALFSSGVAVLGIVVVTGALAIGGFKDETMLMLKLLRIMFPYLVLVCVAAIFMGMLNARGHFFVPALSPTLLNIVLIASTVWLAPRMGRHLDQQVFGLAIGVLAAGVAQALFQLPLLNKDGFRFRFVAPWKNQTVKLVATQMVPGLIGVAAFQINVLLTQGIAFWRDAEIIASFMYAVRLMEFPQGLFGISMATYLLPTLSGMAAEKKYPEFRATLGQGLGYLLFVNTLAAVLLVTLAEPMIRLLFERGQFDLNSTHRASTALVWLAPGLVAFSSVNVLARAFYALGDLKTPMRISVFCLAMNLVLSAALVWEFEQAGLGAANTATSTLNMVLLLYALRKKLGKLDMEGLQRQVLPIVGAAALAGAVAWGARVFWTVQVGHGSFFARLVEVMMPIACATAIYLGITLWTRVPYTRDVLEMFLRRLKR